MARVSGLGYYGLVGTPCHGKAVITADKSDFAKSHVESQLHGDIGHRIALTYGQGAIAGEPLRSMPQEGYGISALYPLRTSAVNEERNRGGIEELLTLFYYQSVDRNDA